MLSKSVPKLLQEANEMNKALEKIDDRLPDGLKAADMKTKMTELDEVNVERTRLVDRKGGRAKNLSDHMVHVRSAVKGIYGSDSEEYDMIGGTRTSERKHHTRKAEDQSA